MSRSGLSSLLVAAALAAGCGDHAPTPPEGLFARADLQASLAELSHAHSHLTGDAERPNPVDTRAQGQIQLKLSEDGETLSYRLIASNIENITQAHLHLGPVEGFGGIVVWLYPSGPPAQLIPGRHGGVLAEGEITAASLVNALAGQPLSALLDAIEAGMIYANVHTSQFPGGEVRGQLRTP